MKAINFEKYNLNNDKIFPALGEMFNVSIELAEGVYGCDLHNHLFNEEQTFIHDNESEEACDSVGTWSAIRLVNTYENDNFGEVTTDIEPCRIAKKELTMMLESDKFARLDKAYKALCDVCFETTIKLARFSALSELRDAVKDWSQDSGLIDTDIR